MGGGFLSFCGCHGILDPALDNEPNMPLQVVLGTTTFETEGQQLLRACGVRRGERWLDAPSPRRVDSFVRIYSYSSITFNWAPAPALLSWE